MRPIHVIGGGLAGSRGGLAGGAQAGVPVVLHEMRPLSGNAGPPHRRARRARLLELVPLRRFASQRRRRPASGDARRWARSSCASADAHQVPAGGALAVDRDGFAEAVEAAVLSHNRS